MYKDEGSMSGVLQELLYYKTEQRKLKNVIKNVEKSKNALTLNPCIIDYIANFGLENISDNWSNSLIKNNDFTSPLVLD
jgi:hypothetical protein